MSLQSRVAVRGIAALVALTSATPLALAQDGAPTRSERSDDRPIDSESKREVPDYGGHPEDSTASEALLWIPRVLFAPLYLVSEYVVRRPLGWAVSKADEARLPQKLEYVFTFGRPERDIGLVPTVLVDFGLRPSVGAYFFWDDFLAPDNDLRARVATGGANWLALSIADRLEWENHELVLRAEYGVRPDLVFHGFGPTTSADEAWYQAWRGELGMRYTGKLWRSSSLSASMKLRDVAFDSTPESGSGTSVGSAIAAGRYASPPGMIGGYAVLISGLEATLDSRERLPENIPPASDWVTPPGGGARIQLRAEQGSDVRAPHVTASGSSARYHWLRYGGTASAFFEFPREQRVFGVSLIADFADPLDRGAEIPFTEQASLGGARPLRGFLDRRLIDRSSLVAQAEYRWPIWIWVDGALQYEIGDVFGRHLEDFRPAWLRQSFGLGLRTNSSRDHSFEALLAFGTRTFEEGAGIENVRFTIGASSGF